MMEADKGGPRPLLVAALSLGLGLLVGSPLSVLVYKLQKRRAKPVDILHSRKWTMLLNWTGYLEKDQFGWAQPPLSEVVGSNGRTKLSGLERPHDYQVSEVSVSFPGPDFGKGSEGCYTTLTDSEGRPLASSGTEMAEALQHWITRGWLDGDERRGLDHIFVCSKNLRYCHGGVKATNFRLSDILESSNTAASSTAVLNENWALYLRESFLEARVVIFVVNEDWMDSIPCNQEFEALVLRKRWLHQQKTAIVFIDITDEKFNQRWGSKLPQLKGTMVHEAQKYFDVYSYTYNMQVSTDQKRAVEQDIGKVVSAYGKRHPPKHSKKYQDLTAHVPTVNWPNWLFFGALEGTNGWRPLLEIREDIPKAYDVHMPVWRSVPAPFRSRRFRLRVMGVADNIFTEGFKFMCRPLQLLDVATGQNIVAPGQGFWRTPGERLHGEHVHGGSLGFSHWCGPKQYSWFEWLIPNEHPAAAVDTVDVRCNAQHWVLEAMPEEVWPSHSKAFLRSYKFFGFDDPMDSTISTAATREPRWVPLHNVDSSLATGSSHTLSSAPACAAFRLRILEAPQEGGSPFPFHTAASLQIQADFPEGLYPLSGGIITGSGGNPLLEDAPPEFAFDGDAQNRWVDINGGGIGNTSWLAYEHPEPVMVKEYTLTTHEYALASYHSHMTGAPRDWTLQALAPGTQEWIEIDRRSDQIFSAHRQTKKFEVATPVLAAKYKLEFTAVGAGCASCSIQVGDVELLAPFPPRTAPLRQPQLVVLSSAYNGVDPEKAASSGMYLSGDYGVSWTEGDQLDLCIPTHDAWRTEDSHEPMLGALRGGRLGWAQGEGRVTQWYDHPMEIDMEPKVQEDLDRPLTSRAMLVERPRKEPVLVDHVYMARFRRSYHDGECELLYTHVRPLCIKAYSFHSCKLYNRGDPRNWALEAETEPGIWVQLHRVTNFHFPDRGAPALFYLPGNTVHASRYHLMITEMKGMVGLLHVSDVMLYAPIGTDRPADLVPVHRREVAHTTIKLRAHDAPGGVVRPHGYTLKPHRLPELGSAFPKAWVLEGLTPDW